MVIFENSNRPYGGDVVRHPSRLVSRGGEKWLTESRFATLNVGGGMEEKLNEVYQMMNERRIDVLCVNETKRKESGTTKQEPYTAYWSGVPSTARACQGVGVILSARMADCVNEFECVSARIIWIRMKVGLTRLFVVGVYAPVDSGTGSSMKGQEEREEFWESLRNVLKLCKDNERLIMLGDFNGWVGVKRDGFERVLGMHGDERVNENGKSLLEICLEWNLCVTNTMFDHKRIHMYTREAKNVRKSMIDFVIVDERVRKKVLDTRAYRGVGIHTDHFLVMSRISGLFKGWRHRVRETTSVLERIKVENLQDDEVKEKYKSKLIERFDGFDDICEIEKLWNVFKEEVVNVASEECGVSKRRKERTVKHVWWDKDVQKVVSEKKKAWLDWLAIRASQRIQKATIEDVNDAKSEYKRIKGLVKEMIARKKDEQKDVFDKRLSEDFQTNIHSLSQRQNSEL